MACEGLKENVPETIKVDSSTHFSVMDRIRARKKRRRRRESEVSYINPSCVLGSVAESKLVPIQQSVTLMLETVLFLEVNRRYFGQSAIAKAMYAI